MPITTTEIKELFHHLESGNNELFFKNVAEDVKWTVLGTHPLAGTYNTRQDFINSTFRRIGRLMKDQLVLKVSNILVQDYTAVVELEAIGTALNGISFYNTYCWILKFKDGTVTEVRAYLDSAMVQKLIDENEG